ncbi:thiamine phosphate synthase [Phenylobacterium kunshanense]|uniref:Thiamine monophosphate synthase n=1 Tax=Phenylobacterium kunshanense TaxID=1445034 RepID=A0A328BJ82_9CAUL|nr:thiamine phosphate synthase [Phenylobacterium kunshanense]RAK67370.1 thiamine monophosphate synthase [Phenylobacterium kunshanense]
MQRTARLLPARRRLRKPLPALLFFTDPRRTPDPEAIARRLPRGAAVVFRHFGAPDAEAQARRLLAIARARGLKLLIGQDAALAARIGADGVHLPERLAHRATALRRAHPRWIVTSAAHALPAARASRADAVVISVALPSRSPSAGGVRALGPIRLAAQVRAAGQPAYALGGINNKTARRLLDAGLVGLAAVEGLTP